MPLSGSVVAAMQELAMEQWSVRGVRSPWHIGDLAWQARRHEGREAGWTIRLWSEGGRVVAWSWLTDDQPRLLEHDVLDEHVHLLDELLAEPRAGRAFAFEDDADRREALARHGFVHPSEQYAFLARDLPDPPVPPPLPAGFSYRTVSEDNVHERVSAHQEVWAPSRMTDASYAAVRHQWPYRESLDCVVEAADGRVAASCLCWPDDRNRVGEFEPVGVRPEFRRRGLGAAVCTYALSRLYEEGGRRAVVLCDSPPACALYESIGFGIHATLVGYDREPADGGDVGSAA